MRRRGGIKKEDRINKDRISLRREKQILDRATDSERAIRRWVIDLVSLTCSRADVPLGVERSL